jgi:hypothetical protein
VNFSAAEKERQREREALSDSHRNETPRPVPFRGVGVLATLSCLDPHEMSRQTQGNPREVNDLV